MQNTPTMQIFRYGERICFRNVHKQIRAKKTRTHKKSTKKLAYIFEIKWKLLNVITLGLRKTDLTFFGNILKWGLQNMIKITGYFFGNILKWGLQNLNKISV